MAAAFPHAGNRAAVALHRAGGIYRVVLPGEQLPAFHPPPPFPWIPSYTVHTVVRTYNNVLLKDTIRPAFSKL